MKRDERRSKQEKQGRRPQRPDLLLAHRNFSAPGRPRQLEDRA
jgi:hypothetical protein